MIFLSFIFNRVFDALTQREGKPTTLPTLVSMTGLGDEQIRSSIANARRTNPVMAEQIKVVTPGRSWKFHASRKVGGYVSPDAVVKEVEVGSTHIWKRVLKALIDNAGKVTSKQLLAERASTEEREITPLQAAHAMDTILRRPNIGPHVETVVAGLAWRWTGSKDGVEPSDIGKAQSTAPVSAPIRGSVLRYFAKQPGVTLFRDDIAQDLGFSVKQVQSAMWHLLNENETTKHDFTVMQSGYAWQYVPNRAVASNAATNVAANAAAPEPSVESTGASTNGHVTPALSAAPIQAYTPAAITTTLPVSSKVPSIPQAGTTAPRLFEEIGQTTEGAILIKESETNVIYRATPLA